MTAKRATRTSVYSRVSPPPHATDAFRFSATINNFTAAIEKKSWRNSRARARETPDFRRRERASSFPPLSSRARAQSCGFRRARTQLRDSRIIPITPSPPQRRSITVRREIIGYPFRRPSGGDIIIIIRGFLRESQLSKRVMLVPSSADFLDFVGSLIRLPFNRTKPLLHTAGWGGRISLVRETTENEYFARRITRYRRLRRAQTGENCFLKLSL